MACHKTFLASLISTLSLGFNLGSARATPSPYAAAVGPYAEGNVKASYEVPVSPELSPYATFDLGFASWVDADGKATLRYDLPLDLTAGEKVPIHLTGESSGEKTILTLQGDQADATCQRQGGTVECRVNYKPLPLSQGQVSDWLAKRYENDPGRALREEVALAFFSEPIGVVRLALAD